METTHVVSLNVAEMEGFEPPCRFRQTDFECYNKNGL